MTDRPDLAAIATRNARRKGGDPARADIIALLTWIDCLEAQLRAGAEYRLVIGGGHALDETERAASENARGCQP